MKGRKPVPTALKILRGNPGQRRLNEAEPEPSVEDVDLEPPAWFSLEQRAEWQEMAELLHRLGLLTQIDRGTLEQYCVAFTRWRDAERHINQLGVLVKSSSNNANAIPMVNPYVSIAREAQKACLKLLVEFGLSPSSRSRVTVSKKPVNNARRDRFFGPGSGSA